MYSIKGTWKLNSQGMLELLFQVGDRSYRIGLNDVTAILRSTPSSSEVVFRHSSDAGDFVCYGSATANGTNGIAVFEADQKAQSELLQLFPHRDTNETALVFAVSGISMIFARVTRSVFPRMDAEDMVGFRVFAIDENYIQRIMTLLPDTSPHGLKALWGNEITAEYISQLRDLGIRDINWRSIIELKSSGVPIDLPLGLRKLGYQDIFVDELIALHKARVDIDFVQQSTRPGAALPSFRSLISLAARRKLP